MEVQNRQVSFQGKQKQRASAGRQVTERRKKTCREFERVRLREAIQVSLTRGITDSRNGGGRDRVPYHKWVRFRIRVGRALQG